MKWTKARNKCFSILTGNVIDITAPTFFVCGVGGGGSGGVGGGVRRDGGHQTFFFLGGGGGGVEVGRGV